MRITKLKEPRPLNKPGPPRAHAFKFVGVITLPPVKHRKLRGLDLVLRSRHSRRDFESPLTVQEISDLLWHSARTRERRVIGNRLWESRIAPSAGGCHPIHFAVLRAPEAKNLALIYDGRHHAFGVVSAGDANLKRCLSEISTCLPFRRGTILWFLADVERTGEKYGNPESLVWRDSGALLATISFSAEAMGFRACGLGVHETPSLRSLFGLPASVVGVGGCIVSA